MSTDYIVPLDALSMADVPLVGGKNASLGEMIRHLSGAGVKVPGASPPLPRRSGTFSTITACAHASTRGWRRSASRT